MVNDLGSMDDLELMPLGGGYMVRRERLMNELLAKGRKAGIVVLYAPDGFGKTSVLLQYTHEVKCDPTRGPVRIIEADRATGARCLCSSRWLPKNSKTNRTPLSRLIMFQTSISTIPKTHRQDSRPARYGGGGLYLLPSFKSSTDSWAGRFG